MTTIDAGAQKPREVAGPKADVADKLWLIVVPAFAIVLIGTAAAIVGLVFRQPNTEYVKPELVLSLFTSAVGFLGGLFVPSPKNTENTQ